MNGNEGSSKQDCGGQADLKKLKKGKVKNGNGNSYVKVKWTYRK